ncbi:hypothetical protein PQX77_013361 [Marasmius sp. AFHP31]|nr:hypothetical protein PQX77_013361 [Marasmius sp. AFHP31]
MALSLLSPYTILILSLLTHVNAAVERSPTPEDYLRLHNDLRAVKNAEPLTWNDKLASYAQNWADKCVRRHSKGQWGENLAWGYGENCDAGKGVGYWINEQYSYNPYHPRPSHYTQMVWKATKQVGCAIAWCPHLYPNGGDLAVSGRFGGNYAHI